MRSEEGREGGEGRRGGREGREGGEEERGGREGGRKRERGRGGREEKEYEGVGERRLKRLQTRGGEGTSVHHSCGTYIFIRGLLLGGYHL